MAGMFFELFIVLTILIVALVALGSSYRKLWALLVAGIIMILAGGVLMGEGIRYESGSTFDVGTGVMTYSYSNLLPADDLTVSIFSNGYLYGGFAVLILAGGLLVFGRGR